MTRPGVAVLALALVSAGCAPTASPDTTRATISVTTVGEPATSSTTAPDDTPVDLCNGFVAWEVGTVHVARCFLAPLALSPDIAGWRSTAANLDAVEGRWTDPEDTRPSIRFVILAYLPELDPPEIIDSILDIDGVDPRQPPESLADTIQVDVDTAPDPTRTGDLREAECALASRALDLGGNEPGYSLLDRVSLTAADMGRLHGLGACRTFRIWAIPIADITITVVATVDDLDRFDELMAMMDQLVDSMTAATP
jgi:hypothetical protein